MQLALLEHVQHLSCFVEKAEAQSEIVREPLRKLPESPWRSFGGFLNYEQWEERERFLLLDRAIEALKKEDAAAGRTFRRSLRKTEIDIEITDGDALPGLALLRESARSKLLMRG